MLVYLFLLVGYASAQLSEQQTDECYDAFSGTARQNGEQWQANSWQYQCIRGFPKIVGCVGSDRAEGQVIPLNQSVTVSGFWFSCFEQNGLLRYSEEPSCLVNGRELHEGETFRNGMFKASCQSWGYDIKGCFFLDAQNVWRELKVNQTAVEGIVRYFCRNIGGRYTTGSEPIGCLKNGKTHQLHEEWIEKNFRYRCTDGGGIDILSCVRPSDSHPVQVGHNFTSDGIVSFCYRFGNTVVYEERACQPHIDFGCVEGAKTSPQTVSATVQAGAGPSLASSPDRLTHQQAAPAVGPNEVVTEVRRVGFPTE